MNTLAIITFMSLFDNDNLPHHYWYEKTSPAIPDNSDNETELYYSYYI